MWLEFWLYDFETHLKSVTDISILLKWMPQNFIDGESTLGQLVAWCLQAPSHYLSYCLPRSVLPCGVIRPQWVNKIAIMLEITWKGEDILQGFLVSRKLSLPFWEADMLDT